MWVSHNGVVEGDHPFDVEYETDRARFLGRGREIKEPAAVVEGGRLSNTTGTVLDPIFALRFRVQVPPGGTARIAFWTGVAGSRDSLMDLLDKHHDANAYVRAATLSWTQAQVQLRHLGVTHQEANLFQELAGHILYTNAALRPSSDAIQRGAAPQSNLWSQGISGDVPIVLLRVDDVDELPIVRQVLQAHEYWRMKQLEVDLVILNDRGASYVQDLQIAIETAVRTSQSRAHRGTETRRGSVFVLQDRPDYRRPAFDACRRGAGSCWSASVAASRTRSIVAACCRPYPGALGRAGAMMPSRCRRRRRFRSSSSMVRAGSPMTGGST
jgi:cyclic beta-1,2-glucan synthetase